MKRVKGLVFLGTPFKAEPGSTWSAMIKNMAQAFQTNDPGKPENDFKHEFRGIADGFTGRLKSVSQKSKIQVFLFCEKQIGNPVQFPFSRERVLY